MTELIDQIKSVIKKLPHSGDRVPYTYHHDYLRQYCEEFRSTSRSYVASNHYDNELELYAIALIQIMSEQLSNVYSVCDLNNEDMIVFNKALNIKNEVLEKYAVVK